MAAYAAHLTRTLQGTPSVFQVTAQEALGATVKPALRKVIEYLATVYPNKCGWCVQWFDELYLVFDCCLQYHYLKHYGNYNTYWMSAMITFPMLGHVGLRAAEYAAFAVQFLRWWESRAGAGASASLPAPPPPPIHILLRVYIPPREVSRRVSRVTLSRSRGLARQTLSRYIVSCVTLSRSRSIARQTIVTKCHAVPRPRPRSSDYLDTVSRVTLSCSRGLARQTFSTQCPMSRCPAAEALLVRLSRHILTTHK
ncbi:putative peroxisome assembly protein 12 [Operophtera brumata]|uniref:Putative peroxisome assembly protein 12 n=1 Tax=Operophtera brumata TaxID=104452 RepID=A0A0L7LEB1_OPEBR|nr:putative peroxisome assembly protein 12 [Operophtera brumata]